MQKNLKRAGSALLSMTLLFGTVEVAMAKTEKVEIPISYKDIKIFVEDKQVFTDKEPFIYDGTTYLPVRAVAEAVGKNVAWDAVTKTVTLSDGANALSESSVILKGRVEETQITADFRDIKIMVGDKEVETDKEPFMYDGTTYLPVRAVAEAVGRDVEWDKEAKTVTLSAAESGLYGEIGDTCMSAWFTFRINSIETKTMYKGKSCTYGRRFMVVNISEKNTWNQNQPIDMGIYDFFVQGDGLSEEVYAEGPWDVAMMPGNFTLQPGEEVTYDLVFEVPTKLDCAELTYVEMGVDGTVMDTFILKYYPKTEE